MTQNEINDYRTTFAADMTLETLRVKVLALNALVKSHNDRMIAIEREKLKATPVSLKMSIDRRSCYMDGEGNVTKKGALGCYITVKKGFNSAFTLGISGIAEKIAVATLAETTDEDGNKSTSITWEGLKEDQYEQASYELSDGIKTLCDNYCQTKRFADKSFEDRKAAYIDTIRKRVTNTLDSIEKANAILEKTE